MKSLLCLTMLAISVATGVAQTRTPSLPTLTATVQDTFVRPLIGGNSITKTVSGQLYRDEQGRTCIVRGQLWTIQDPAAKTLIVVDLNAKTARRFVANQAPSPGQSMSAITNKQAHQDLGSQEISGVSTKGFQFTVVMPPGAVGNLGPLTETSEVWRSEELGLTVETQSTDPINGEHTQIFTNIVTNVAVDPSWFSVPAAVQVVDVQPVNRSGSQKLQ